MPPMPPLPPQPPEAASSDEEELLRTSPRLVRRAPEARAAHVDVYEHEVGLRAPVPLGARISEATGTSDGSVLSDPVVDGDAAAPGLMRFMQVDPHLAGDPGAGASDEHAGRAMGAGGEALFMEVSPHLMGDPAVQYENVGILAHEVPAGPRRRSRDELRRAQRHCAAVADCRSVRAAGRVPDTSFYDDAAPAVYGTLRPQGVASRSMMDDDAGGAEYGILRAPERSVRVIPSGDTGGAEYGTLRVRGLTPDPIFASHTLM